MTDGTKRPKVVGIGASAGGLAALRALFERIPPDTGLAFVVVVHLSPEHESHLADLIQPHCQMPVEQVQEELPLAPDHVYVIPPGRNLNTIDSHLRLSPLEERPAWRTPIDHFFRTLSETHGDQSIGVVLTGTGTDGTRGLELIRASGGLTIVQDPEEAEFDGMPRSAIGSGFVDRVLPLDQIVDHVVAFSSTEPEIEVPDEDAPLSESDQRTLQLILNQVRARTGHDMSGYKHTTVLRRLRRRMQLHGRPLFPEYLELLREDPEEAKLLFEDLLISVTSFFRDPAVFQHLETEVIPELLAGKEAGGAVRVWSVGCSTGEEAYTLAILLYEAIERMEIPPLVQIFATDLHESSLIRARDGVFPESIESDLSPARLARFFTRLSDGYRLRKEVREMVVIAPHNLLRDPPFSHLDLISCRNMLIYVDRHVQRSIIELFHYALDPDGFLLLGSSETIDRSELFVPVHKAYCLFRRRDVFTPSPRLPVLGPTSGLTPRLRPTDDRSPVVPPPVGGRGFGSLHEQMVERFAPPSVLVDGDLHVLHYSVHAGDYLLHPGGEPTNDLLRLIRDDLRIELRAAMFSAKERGEPVTSTPVTTTVDGDERHIVIRVRPAIGDDQLRGLFLVLFDEVEMLNRPPVIDGAEIDPTVAGLQMEIELLQQHLQTLIGEYEAGQEEMRASSEEMQSSNEELRSTLEELETSKEELQSVNEELITLNQENRHKVEELRLLSSDLQNLLVGTDIATLFLDRQLRIMRFTPQVEELFNIRSTDRGRPLSDLTHQLGYEDISADAESVLRHLAPIEREIASKDRRWFLTRVLPYRTTDDRIEGVVITFVDISRRREAELALRDSEARLRLALEAGRMGAWSWDLSADEFVADATTKYLFGFGVHDLVDFEALVATSAPDARAELVAAADRARTGDGQRFDVEVRVGPEEGGRWLVVSGQGYSSVHDDLTETGRLAGTVLDITSRKETEQSLARRVEQQTEAIRRSERRFRALVEASSQIVWTTDARGQVVEDSPAWRAFTGQDLAAMIAAGWLDAVHPEDRRRVEQSWLAVVDRRGELDAEFRLHHEPSGGWRWVAARSVPVHEPDDDLLGWVGMITDIDARKRADQQIRALASKLTMAEHEERRRIAHVLHDDLQQRLHSIQMRTGLLKEALDEGGDDVGSLDEIGRLLEDSVDLTRSLAVDLSPPILAGEGLADALGWLATQMAERHGLTVEVDARRAFPVADDDMRVFLFQIVRELLFNVVKHAGVDHARVVLDDADDMLCIEVADRGRGFAPGTEGSGGMGLASATERLALFGGRIEIESEPGGGATVRVTIPPPDGSP
jgi:two-component system CheB/CheR fusion protein